MINGAFLEHILQLKSKRSYIREINGKHTVIVDES